MLHKILLLFLLQIVYSNSARILGIVPTPSYSHQVPFQPIWRELSLRGHQMVVLTPNPINDPTLTNLTEIDLHFVYNFWNSQTANLTSGKYSNGIVATRYFVDVLIASADLELQHPKVKEIINDENQQFDLIIVEYLNPIMYAFGERFKCPVIGMITVDAPNYMLSDFGNPTHPILNSLVPYLGEMNIFQRLLSVVTDIVLPIVWQQSMPNMQKVVDKHFGNNFADVTILHKNICLLFSNGNFGYTTIKPLVPAVIQIGGGIHMQPPKPLPPNLRTFLDDATVGFIYFSLGSNVKSKDFSSETKSVILETLSELPYKVLWKFEDKNLVNISKNILISKWVPQHDVLRYPNIKLFISQGGYQSIEEALNTKVPILGIPFLGDQDNNINYIVNKGLGLRMDDSTKITKAELKTKILEVIQNPKYRNRVEQISNLIMDQPMTGLEKAVWWSEYVIRHKGAKHLRSPALDLPAYQYYLLDVISFFISVSVVVIFLIYKGVKFVVKLCKHIFVNKSKLE